jgi:hypothetical protein
MSALEVGQGPVDAHLVLDEIRLGERYVQLTGHEECVSLRSASVEITGGARVNSGGMRRLQRGGYRWGDWGRGGDISCRLLVTHDRYKLVESFVHGSGGLRLLVEPLLHLLEPFFVHGRGVDNFQRLLWRGTGGSRL